MAYVSLVPPPPSQPPLRRAGVFWRTFSLVRPRHTMTQFFSTRPAPAPPRGKPRVTPDTVMPRTSPPANQATTTPAPGRPMVPAQLMGGHSHATARGINVHVYRRGEH